MSSRAKDIAVRAEIVLHVPMLVEIQTTTLVGVICGIHDHDDVINDVTHSNHVAALPLEAPPENTYKTPENPRQKKTRKCLKIPRKP